jgi:hypothetical protein
MECKLTVAGDLLSSSAVEVGSVVVLCGAVYLCWPRKGKRDFKVKFKQVMLFTASLVLFLFSSYASFVRYSKEKAWFQCDCPLYSDYVVYGFICWRIIGPLVHERRLAGKPSYSECGF